MYFAGPGDSRPYLWLAMICLVMGSVTSYARAKAEGMGYDAQVGIAERADRLVAILVMTGLGAIYDLPLFMEVTLWVRAIASPVNDLQRTGGVRTPARKRIVWG